MLFDVVLGISRKHDFNIFLYLNSLYFYYYIQVTKRVTQANLALSFV